MAHLAPQTAIFSPSVARAAASTAKDWAYVDGWLRSRYRTSASRKPPSFERNPETLKALLALVGANEAADEERDQLARVEEAALQEVRAAEEEKARRREARDGAKEAGKDNDETAVDGELVAEDLLHAIEDNLSRESTTALDAMAHMAVELGMAYPQPEALGTRFVELQGKALELEQRIHRVKMLQEYMEREATRMEDLIEELRSDEYQPESDLARQNLELQRKIKSAAAKLPELKQQVIALEKAVGIPGLSVEDVRVEEEAYLELLAKKKDLDAQVKAFAGLPPDVEAARAELEALRTELREATERRDTNFEMLVERESPVKTRKRP